jgi:hypothetical protein
MATACDLSQYARRKLLDHINGKTSFTMPAGSYLTCFAGDPFGAGTEVAGVTRQAITWGAADTDGIAANSGDIVFAAGSFDGETVDYYAIYDASENGNLIWRAQLAFSKTPTAADSLTCPSGELLTKFPASL